MKPHKFVRLCLTNDLLTAPFQSEKACEHAYKKPSELTLKKPLGLNKHFVQIYKIKVVDLLNYKLGSHFWEPNKYSFLSVNST